MKVQKAGLLMRPAGIEEDNIGASEWSLSVCLEDVRHWGTCFVETLSAEGLIRRRRELFLYCRLPSLFVLVIESTMSELVRLCAR